MRNFLLVFSISLFSFGASATHVLGGDITWKCVGQGQYVFQLNLFKECAGGSPSLGNLQSISGPNGTVQLSLFNQQDISPSCQGGAGVFCGMTGPGNGAVELNQYESAPVTLSGTPPASGWVFSWDDCCRPGGLVNINSVSNSGYYISSVMYSNPALCNSSPHFASSPARAISLATDKSFSAFAQSYNGADSLYYGFYHPQATATQLVNFNTGYATNVPFPNPATDTANGLVSINHRNGLISIDVNSAVYGAYVYGIKVEQWRNNVLMAEVRRDAATAIKALTQQDNAPVVGLDSTKWSTVAVSGQNLSVQAYPGDTVYFELRGSDLDYNYAANRFQWITFTAAGRALDSTWGGIAGYTTKPVISPVSQVGFLTQVDNRVSFYWPITAEHVHGNTTGHFFQFSFADEICPFNAKVDITLEVQVKSILSIGADSLALCQGDTVALNGSTKSGQYQWSPANGLSSTTAASPLASPSTSQYYFLTDPQNPGLKDSVYVDVTPKGTFNFTFNSGQLQLNDSAQTTTRVWYYNGIPFSHPYDTLTPFGLGDYYVIGKAGGCQYISDTVSITMGMSFSVTNTGNGAYNGSPMIVTGSQGVTFQVNHNVNVSWVSLPGLVDLHAKTGGYDLKLQVFDNNQAEIFSKDITLTKPIDDVLKVGTNFSLNANQDYTVAISGDTAYAFSVFENVQLPATPFNVGFTIKSVAEGGFGQFPTDPTDYMVPISLGIDRTVDLDENALHNWNLYPNPASGQVYISGLKEATSVELIDVNGRIVKVFQLEEDQPTLQISKAGLSSGLYFVKVHFENTTSVKKVLFQ